MYMCPHCNSKSFTLHQTVYQTVDVETDNEGVYREGESTIEDTSDLHLFCLGCATYLSLDIAENHYKKSVQSITQPGRTH